MSGPFKTDPTLELFAAPGRIGPLVGPSAPPASEEVPPVRSAAHAEGEGEASAERYDLPLAEGHDVPRDGHIIPLTGERGVALATGARGPTEVYAHLSGDRSPAVLENLSLAVPGRGGFPITGGSGGVRAARTAHAPGSLRRALAEPSVTEVTLVPRSFPGAVVQWTRGEASGAARVGEEREAGVEASPDPVPLDLLLAWEVRAEGEEARYLQRGPFLRVSSGDGIDRLFIVTGDPLASWTVREPRRGDPSVLRVEVRLQLAHDRRVHLAALAAVAGGESALTDALATLPHLAALERRRHREGSESRTERLTVRAPVEVGRAIEGACTTLDAAWIRPAGGDRVVADLADPRRRFSGLEDADAAAATLAALASGQFDVAHVLLEGLTKLARAAGPSPVRDHWLLAVAEHALWTGDLRRLARDRALVERAVRELEPPRSADAAARRRDALVLLADAVEPLGDRAWSAQLRALAAASAAGLDASCAPATSPLGPGGAGECGDPGDTEGPGEPPGPRARGGTPLPVLAPEALSADPRGAAGGKRRPPEADAPPRDAAPGMSVPPETGVPPERAGAPLVDWPGRADFLAGKPEAGARAWGARLSGTARRGSWLTVEAANTILPFVFGVLGARPDASCGRLRLAPSPPSGWNGFEAANLRMGDSTVTIGYRKRGRRHTFTLTQTSGRAPINLVFEPVVARAGSEPTVRLADEIVEVNTFERGARTGIRLQLPLDHERRVTIDEGHLAAR